MTTKQLDIKNRSYYLYNDLINLPNFSMNNLKLDKKTWRDIDIYYIGYVDKNKPENWFVNSVNLLYLMINRVFCFVGEENGVKYLKIDKGNKKIEDSILSLWNEVFTGIKHYIKKLIMNVKHFLNVKDLHTVKNLSKIKFNYGENYDRIKFISNDDLPIGKLIHFPTITVTIRCVFKKEDFFYPQVHLDDALYQL